MIIKITDVRLSKARRAQREPDKDKLTIMWYRTQVTVSKNFSVRLPRVGQLSEKHLLTEQWEEHLQRHRATDTNRLQVRQEVCACLCTRRKSWSIPRTPWESSLSSLSARKQNRKWEEFSAATTWCSLDRCLPEPSPTEDWEREKERGYLVSLITI